MIAFCTALFRDRDRRLARTAVPGGVAVGRVVPWLCAAGVLVGCSSTPSGRADRPRGSAYPSYTIFPSTAALPGAVVAALPDRIEGLSSNFEPNLRELLGALGLSRFEDRVSVNVRWNHYFFAVSDEQVLYFMIDVERHDDNPWIMGTDWEVPVIGCVLYGEGRRVLARWNYPSASLYPESRGIGATGNAGSRQTRGSGIRRIAGRRAPRALEGAGC